MSKCEYYSAGCLSTRYILILRCLCIVPALGLVRIASLIPPIDGSEGGHLYAQDIVNPFH